MNDLVFQPPGKCHVGINTTVKSVFHEELQRPLSQSDCVSGISGLATYVRMDTPNLYHVT